MIKIIIKILIKLQLSILFQGIFVVINNFSFSFGIVLKNTKKENRYG